MRQSVKKAKTYMVLINGTPYLNGASEKDESFLAYELERDGFNVVSTYWDTENRIVYVEHEPTPSF